MRKLALLAALVCLCGCNSRSAKPPETASDHEALASPVVTADATHDASHAAAPDQPDADDDSLRQAQKLTAQGQLAAAVEACSNFIGTHPKSAQAFRLRAVASAMRHNDADAAADFSTAIILEPQSASHRIARGMFHLTHGNTTKAIEDFDVAIKLEPKNAQALNNRGMARVTAGEIKAALEDFNKAIEIEPKYVSAYTNRSYALVKLDRRKDALTDLDVAVNLDPKAAGAYDSRGALYLELKDYKNALADFTSAIKIVQNNPVYYHHRRAVYLKLERYTEAEADGAKVEHLMQLVGINEAVFRDRRSPKPYLDRGEYLLADGQINDAIANFDHVISTDASQWRAYVGRARALVRKGDFQKAIDDASTALKLEQNEDAYAVRAEAYRKLHQFPEALADYDAAQRFDADVVETWIAYSKELHASGKTKEAEDALKRANDLKALDAPRIQRVAATTAAPTKTTAAATKK
jgi:tetratricopeptide (TPR) repeat protein